MSNNSQHFEELELVAEKAGELNDRVGKIESELGTQTKTLESAAMVLDAAIKGLGALKSQVLENDIGALQLQINDKTSHLAREIGRFESAVAEIDRRSEAGDEQLNAALRDTALGLRTAFDAKSAEITEWSVRVEREIAAHSVALAAIPPVIKGADAKTFNPRGEWQAGMIVNALDVVSYNGSSFISNVDGNTDKPTRSDKFTTLAKRSGNGAGGATDFASLTGITSPSQIASGVTAWQVGDLLYANTTGTLATIHPGTSGQVLISNGSGSAPSYYTATGGAGDVNGPSSATDNALTRFDGTGGKIVQNSTVTLSDTGIFSSLADAGGTIAAQRNALAPAQGLVFDGTASCSQAVSADGTSDFSKFVLLYLTAQPSGDLSLTSTAVNASTFMVKNGTRRLSMGKYAVGYVASTSSTDIPLNVWCSVGVVRTGGVLTYYLNSVADGTSVDVYDYSAAATSILGSGMPSGSALRPVSSLNRALSAAEVLALYQSGAVASGDFNLVTNDSGTAVGASNTSLVTGANSTFASNSGWWTLGGANPPTISGGVCTFIDGSSTLSRASFLKIGSRYSLLVGTKTGNLVFDGGSGAQVITAGTATVFTATQTALTFYTSAGGTMDNVTILPLGALIAPEPQALGSGLVWRDVSGNAANITLPASGVSWALPWSGTLGFASGTNAAPTVTFGADTNTGLYLDATNVLGVATNGAGTVLFSSSSGVGKIKAHGTRVLALEAGTGNTNITLTPSGTGNILTTGNLLIGTTTDAGQKLQVNGAATFAGTVAIGNTVATGVAVASTHKVTMVIGGVTYYLLASNV